MTPTPSTGRGRSEHVHERSSDPADAADRPLEPKASDEPLRARDDEEGGRAASGDPHHRLNTSIGEPDPTADSDPYRPRGDGDDADRASGVRGVGQDSERR